ncbi:MAG: glucans biosynthesis glucosyltransferase MdoH [Gammaproteobacteria bacterium]|nr:glucans biosynthesis glucosyltransferase MdoH [Gammaproteobacteria bacterium]
MELYPAAGLTALLKAEVEAPAALSTYLECLPLPLDERGRLRQCLANRAGGDAREALAELHRLLAERPQTLDPDDPAAASVSRRLTLAYGTMRDASGRPLLQIDRRGQPRLVTVPPLNRATMIPRSWPRNPLTRMGHWLHGALSARRGRLASRAETAPDSPDPHGRWRWSGLTRRLLLLLLALAQTALATYYMTAVLPYHGTHGLELSILIVYAVLFAWVSAGFWTAMMGFWVLLLGGDRHAISRTAAPDTPIDASARTAILVPICNENVARVLAGLRATYESVARTGWLERFDFFILSDSSEPDLRVAEIAAWRRLSADVGGFGRIFYRRRRHRIKRKSGNIADFCRRWGSNYRYMIVLDADSVMSGECITQLVRLMEANANAGIIQTAPRAAGRETLYARMQQFATRVYGPLFTAGLHFWQLGESHYWGHNAIIRIAPFIRHCALRRLPGRGALSGEILSHDFVEAALMRRAGWAVWIAYDLPGSYEEMPPNLLDELKRDRRWCQGNLQNFRLFFAQGLHPAHRAVFMTGVMAYLSAPLWFLLLLLSTAQLAVQTLMPPQYFPQPYQLFPIWPEWHPGWAIALFSATATLLFLPKLLAAVLVMVKGARAFGGARRLIPGMLLELVFSALLAPIRMLFHTRFVISALIGWTVSWKSPPREDAETSWVEALRRHGPGTLLGAFWAGGLYRLNPDYLWWLAPIVGAMLLAIPLSVWSSRVRLGRCFRRLGLFLIPEESAPPPELQAMLEYLQRAPADPGFIAAVIAPDVNALICATGAGRIHSPATVRRQRLRLLHRATRDGPEQLDTNARNVLLGDPKSLSSLHFRVWSAAEAAAGWGIRLS